MPIIKKPSEVVSREFRLEEPVSLTLDHYAKFIGSTPDHVIASALRFVFWKDLDFKRWQKEQRKLSHQAPSTQVKKA